MFNIQSDIKGEGKKKIVTERGAFGDRIKLSHKTPIKHNSPYLPDGHLSILILGTSGSGKSHLLLDIVPQIANLQTIIACTLIATNPVFVSMQDWCKQKDIEFHLVSDPLTARSTIESAIDSKDENKEGLIIFDDFSSQKSSRSDPYNNVVATTSAMLRNYGFHNIFITQSSLNVPTLYRNNSNVRCVFAMNDIYSIRSIRADLVASRAIKSNEDFDSLFDLVQKNEHAYLMIISKGTKRDIFIYLPSFGENSPPRKVMMNIADELEDDKKLKDLIQKFRTVRGSGNDSYSYMVGHKLLNHIRDYLLFLARSRQESLDDLILQVNQLYDIDL